MSDFPLPQEADISASIFNRVSARTKILLPGLALTIALTAAAWVLQYAEIQLAGRAWLEALVLAILVGAAVRSAWTPPAKWFPGIDFSAKTLLEVAVMLLGASVSAETLLRIGPALIGGIVAVVAVAITASYGFGRLLGLPRRMAILVACGNSICGNSAIAAVAPVIGADSDDVAASIAFSGVLGVIVMLTLPLLIPVLKLTLSQYGVLAGLTIYAVPQVLAATMPVGPLALKIGTLVKLVRVVTLGPVVLGLSLISSRLREEPDEQPPATARHLAKSRFTVWCRGSSSASSPSPARARFTCCRMPCWPRPPRRRPGSRSSRWRRWDWASTCAPSQAPVRA